MGWIAKPGSAEDRLNQWMTRKNTTVLFLLFSVFYSGLLAWTILDWLKPHWRFLVFAPGLYGLGAAISAVMLWRSKQPSRALWMLAYFFAALPFTKMFIDSGIVGGVIAALQ